MYVIKDIVQKFLNGEGTIGQLAQKYKVKAKDIKSELEKQGYVIKSGYRLSTIIGLKKGVEEYIQNINNNPSITKICAKYGMTTKTLSDRLKELGVEIINHQNKTKFNENIFDSIDTEEKAYWLGFIFADGYISSSTNEFELSLKASDKEHLDRFNVFMGHINDNVKVGNVKCGEIVCKRCRWNVRNRHLWETLNDYGCTPKKSLTLEFPPERIFKSQDLIKHFIRGYFDGDGCISYSNKEHSVMEIHFLGTEDFLTNIKKHLPVKFDYVLGIADEHKKNLITRVMTMHGKNGLDILFYLYHNSLISLNRKYERYLEYCRLYSEEYKLLQTNIGEDCDVNPEITEETKESSVS